jgi:hypothetical protein
MDLDFPPTHQQKPLDSSKNAAVGGIGEGSAGNAHFLSRRWTGYSAPTSASTEKGSSRAETRGTRIVTPAWDKANSLWQNKPTPQEICGTNKKSKSIKSITVYEGPTRLSLFNVKIVGL